MGCSPAVLVVTRHVPLDSNCPLTGWLDGAGANGLASLVLQCLWESFALPVIVNPLVMSQQADAPRQQAPSKPMLQTVLTLHDLLALPYLHLKCNMGFCHCYPQGISVYIMQTALPMPHSQTKDKLIPVTKS